MINKRRIKGGAVLGLALTSVIASPVLAPVTQVQTVMASNLDGGDGVAPVANVLSWDFIADTFNNTANDAHAELDLDTGTLTIRGTNSMAVSLGNYKGNGDAALNTYLKGLPFTAYKSSIKKIIIGNGISGISNNMFNSYTALQEVEITNTSSNTSISLGCAFQGCTSLKSVKIISNSEVMLKHGGIDYYAVDKSPFRGCTNLEELDIKATTIKIDMPGFNCQKLKRLKLNATNVTFDNSIFPTQSIEEVTLGYNTSVSLNTDLFYDSKWAIDEVSKNGYAKLGSNLVRIDDTSKDVEIPSGVSKLLPKSLINNSAVELNFGDRSYTMYSNSMQLSKVKRLIINTAGSLNSNTNYLSSMSSLNEVIYKGSESVQMNLTKSTINKVYWLGGISSSMTKDLLNSTTTVYCLEGSTVQAWCENVGQHYVLLSDKEADEIINGVAPELPVSTKLYDATTNINLTITVSLGTKPAGASSISKVLVDNALLSTDMWEFNGTDTVTIKSEYLNTLVNGSHTIGIEFDNGVFSTGSTVTVINSSQSDSGDSGNSGDENTEPGSGENTANPSSKETVVAYDGQGINEYFLEVPVLLNPGDSGDVKLYGTWDCQKVVNVTTSDKVTLVNDMNENLTKELTVTFNNIALLGDNTTDVSAIQPISVGNIENALFGRWEGKIVYNVTVNDLEDTGN